MSEPRYTMALLPAVPISGALAAARAAYNQWNELPADLREGIGESMRALWTQRSPFRVYQRPTLVSNATAASPMPVIQRTLGGALYAPAYSFRRYRRYRRRYRRRFGYRRYRRYPRFSTFRYV